MGRLQPYVQKWLLEGSRTQRDLSELAGVPIRRIYCILKGYDKQYKHGRVYMYHHVTFSTADKLLTAMDMWDEWYEALADIYEEVE